MQIVVVPRLTRVKKATTRFVLLRAGPSIALEGVTFIAAPVQVAIETNQVRPRMKATLRTMMVNHAACLTSQEVLVAQTIRAPIEEIGAQVASVAGVVGVGACQNAAREDQLNARGLLCVCGFLGV